MHFHSHIFLSLKTQTMFVFVFNAPIFFVHTVKYNSPRLFLLCFCTHTKKKWNMIGSPPQVTTEKYCNNNGAFTFFSICSIWRKSVVLFAKPLDDLGKQFLQFGRGTRRKNFLKSFSRGHKKMIRHYFESLPCLLLPFVTTS